MWTFGTPGRYKARGLTPDVFRFLGVGSGFYSVMGVDDQERRGPSWSPWKNWYFSSGIRAGGSKSGAAVNSLVCGSTTCAGVRRAK